MKKLCAFLYAVLLFSCGDRITEAQNHPKDIAGAFRSAGIPVLEKPVDPKAFSLALLNGGRAELSAYKGKVVLLNFWATWCPPCRAEMPSMETVYKRFKDQGLEILAVDCAEEKAAVERFMEKNKYSYPVLLDTDGTVSSLYGIEAIPTTFILNREGKIITRIVGSLRWNDPKIIAAIEAAL
ncbi:MAG: TlpA family protein disulfide reductase [Spirochaetaceae bacterium]|nr:TlpA family protein disulfide reductase [Spirochaetaceae bacterium]